VSFLEATRAGHGCDDRPSAAIRRFMASKLAGEIRRA
jgi:hypothetical protein